MAMLEEYNALRQEKEVEKHKQKVRVNLLCHDALVFYKFIAFTLSSHGELNF